jgi:hypothetical protein
VAEIRQLAADLPGLWQAETTTAFLWEDRIDKMLAVRRQPGFNIR